jgi:hypothetical protein
MSVSLDVDRGITYEVVGLTAAETKAAAGIFLGYTDKLYTPHYRRREQEGLGE